MCKLWFKSSSAASFIAFAMQRNATTTGSANSAEAGDGTALFDSNRYSRTLREFYIFLYPYIML